MNRRGFTLLEIILSIGVAIIVFSFLLVAGSRYLVISRLEETRDTVLWQMKRAREQTQTSVGAAAYGVHFDANQVVLFRGPTYGAGAPTNEVYALPADYAITATNLTAGRTDVLFNRLTGATATTGTVIVGHEIEASLRKTLRIYENGIIAPE